VQPAACRSRQTSPVVGLRLAGEDRVHLVGIPTDTIVGRLVDEVVVVPAAELLGPVVFLGLLVVGLADIDLADRAARPGDGGGVVGSGHPDLVLAGLAGFARGDLPQVGLDRSLRGRGVVVVGVGGPADVVGVCPAGAVDRVEAGLAGSIEDSRRVGDVVLGGEAVAIVVGDGGPVGVTPSAASAPTPTISPSSLYRTTVWKASRNASSSRTTTMRIVAA